MTRRIFDLLALRRVESQEGVTTFESVVNPEAIGRGEGTIAFGGFAIASALHAACQSLSMEQLTTAIPHSIIGNFLASSSTQRPIRLSVSTIRDSRSFATRLVTVTQVRKDGGPFVPCLFASVDFFISPRTLTLVEYSVPRKDTYAHHSKLAEYRDALRLMVDQGKVPKTSLEMYLQRNENCLSLIQSKIPPGSVTYDIAGGHDPKRLGLQSVHTKTPVWGRMSVDWFRFHHMPERPSKEEILTLESRQLASACALAFILDMVSFYTTMHSFIDLEDVSAVASLDFALRFHADDLDATRWHVRECGVPVAANERSYCELKCWQEKDDGKMQLIATMTQAAIARRKQSAL